MDRILIIDLVARCIIGVDDEERRDKQDVVINIALETDIRKPAASDDFADAVDYRAIKKAILMEVEQSQFMLLETLAERVAMICLSHVAIQRTIVRVEKPSALRFARSVGIEITRERGAMP